MAKSRLIIKIVKEDTCVVVRQEYKNGRWRYGDEIPLSGELSYEQATELRDQLEAEDNKEE